MLLGLVALLVTAVPVAAQGASRHSKTTGVIHASATVVQTPQVSALTPQDVAHLLLRNADRVKPLRATSGSFGMSIDRARQPEMSVVIELVNAMPGDRAGSFLMCQPTDERPDCHERAVGVPLSVRQVLDAAPTLFFMHDARRTPAVLRATITYIAS